MNVDCRINQLFCVQSIRTMWIASQGMPTPELMTIIIELIYFIVFYCGEEALLEAPVWKVPGFEKR